MDEFPFDILYNIFTRLHFVNKLECMYVCRRWANVIREGSLLHTASIIQSEKITLDGFFDLLEDEPWRRKQVKILLLGHTRWPYVHDCFRPDLLPNLRLLYLSKNMGKCKHYIQHLPPESVKPFMNHIEQVFDYAGSDFVYELLSEGTCPRLTSLVLRLNYYSGYTCNNHVDDNEYEESVNKRNRYLNKSILSFLFNAPALQKLEIHNFDCQISDFELIHASLLQLQSLTIKGRVLQGDKLPHNVLPTGSLKKLVMTELSATSLSQSNFVRYVTKKYTRLSEFIFHTLSSSLKESDANDFMRKCSSQLKSIRLPVETSNGLAQWVSQFDCQLHTLEVSQAYCVEPLNSLIQFNQYAYLKNLKVSYLSHFDTGPLKELNNLTKLHLIFSGASDPPEIDIDNLLRNCSDNLKSLEMTYVTLKNEILMDQQFGIQELKLNTWSLPKDFDIFLSKCCPKLRILDLIRCLRAGEHLRIPNLCLSHLKIHLHDPKIKTRWSVFTSKSELSYYFDEYDDTYRVDQESHDKNISYLLYKACVPVKSIESCKVKTTTSISCGSVDTLIINDRIAC